MHQHDGRAWHEAFSADGAFGAASAAFAPAASEPAIITTATATAIKYDGAARDVAKGL